MSKFCLFQNVKLVSDKYSNENLHKGSVGTILEIWDDKNYEVEFCYENGETLYLGTFCEAELEETM